jgi:hypothetical protein
MGMQTLMPNGETLTEYFKDEKAMNERRKDLERLGGKVQRVVRLHVTDPSKYKPHQGKKEASRRQRQLLRASQK